MSDQVNNSTTTSADTRDLGRSQAIFIAIGAAIVLGGLWLLYNADGPYHPEIPVSGTQVQASEGS